MLSRALERSSNVQVNTKGAEALYRVVIEVRRSLLILFPGVNVVMEARSLILRTRKRVDTRTYPPDPPDSNFLGAHAKYGTPQETRSRAMEHNPPPILYSLRASLHVPDPPPVSPTEPRARRRCDGYGRVLRRGDDWNLRGRGGRGKACG